MFSYEDGVDIDFGDIDEIPSIPGSDQLVSGRSVSMETQTRQVCVCLSVCAEYMYTCRYTCMCSYTYMHNNIMCVV